MNANVSVYVDPDGSELLTAGQPVAMPPLANHYAVDMSGAGWPLLKEKLSLDIRNKGLGWAPNKRTLLELLAIDRLVPDEPTPNVVISNEQLTLLLDYAFDQWEMSYSADQPIREMHLSKAVDDLVYPTAIRFIQFPLPL